MERRGGPAPIFILGIAQRAGTHFLYDALLLHDEVAPAVLTPAPDRPSWEDHLLSEADGLTDYVDRVRRHWNLDGPAGSAAAARLGRSLGDGIARFLAELAAEGGAAPNQRPLCKTPALDNLGLIGDLLPDASVIVITRDPRAVVASALASFGKSPERWMRVWRRNARILLAFMRHRPGVVTVVRYEELHADPVTTLKSVLDRLALDPSAYDFDALRALPVRGSSQTAAEGWTPVAAGPDFDPLGRGTNLGSAMGRRLEWLLASEMRELGYASPPAPPHVLARTRQRLLDARWALAHVFSRTTRAVGAGGAEFRRDRTRVIDGRRAAAGPEQLAAEAPSAG